MLLVTRPKHIPLMYTNGRRRSLDKRNAKARLPSKNKHKQNKTGNPMNPEDDQSNFVQILDFPGFTGIYAFALMGQQY